MQVIRFPFGNSGRTFAIATRSAMIAFATAILVHAACADTATNVTTWFYGWTPQLAPNILTNPVSVTVTPVSAQLSKYLTLPQILKPLVVPEATRSMLDWSAEAWNRSLLLMT